MWTRRAAPSRCTPPTGYGPHSTAVGAATPLPVQPSRSPGPPGSWCGPSGLFDTQYGDGGAKLRNPRHPGHLHVSVRHNSGRKDAGRAFLRLTAVRYTERSSRGQEDGEDRHRTSPNRRRVPRDGEDHRGAHQRRSDDYRSRASKPRERGATPRAAIPGKQRVEGDPGAALVRDPRDPPRGVRRGTAPSKLEAVRRDRDRGRAPGDHPPVPTALAARTVRPGRRPERADGKDPERRAETRAATSPIATTETGG